MEQQRLRLQQEETAEVCAEGAPADAAAANASAWTASVDGRRGAAAGIRCHSAAREERRDAGGGGGGSDAWDELTARVGGGVGGGGGRSERGRRWEEIILERQETAV